MLEDHIMHEDILFRVQNYRLQRKFNQDLVSSQHPAEVQDLFSPGD